MTTSGTMAASLGADNPFRYRGYYFDNETGMYYLNARYYNPQWGRFINADSYGGVTGTLLSHNAFVYCLSNPVMGEDPSGNIDPDIFFHVVETHPAVIYLRTDPLTGEQYVGRTKSWGRYIARQYEEEHELGKKFDWEVIRRATLTNMRHDEQEEINKRGGPKKYDGPLANKRNEIAKSKWDETLVKLSPASPDDISGSTIPMEPIIPVIPVDPIPIPIIPFVPVEPVIPYIPIPVF